MYDKSRKTWSQRLKIHNNEKSQATTTGNTNSAASITTIATNNSQSLIASGVTTKYPHQSITAALNISHNVNDSRISMPQYQIAQTAIMHLPTLNDYHTSGAGSAYEYMPNHMARSMKYAEPWIYGTVRGIPVRPAGIYHPAYAHYAGHQHAATLFAAPTTDLATVPATATAVAVVLCSCHEYLSGTKGRSLKKPNICKKCKGTRLPLHNIGGTMRLPTNLPNPKLRPVGNASTVRVVSTSKKIRPTILDPQKDPYDMMRRTRLLSPEPGSAVASGGSSCGAASSRENSRHRGKSTSPIRGRSRIRSQNFLISNNTSPKESSKVLESFSDNWLTESEDLATLTASSIVATSNRKSILRCNVNPYDLISINNQTSAHNTASLMQPQSLLKEENKKSYRKQNLQFSQNEFMPPNDDFNVQDAALTEEEPPFLQTTTKIKLESSKPDKIKKLIEEPPPSPPQPQATPPQNKKPNYINVQAIAGQRVSLGEEQHVSKSLLQQTADGTTTYENFTVESDTLSNPIEMKKSGKTRPDTLQVPLSESKKTLKATRQTQDSSNDSKESLNNSKESIEDEEELMVTVTVTPTYNIKSILKRPNSKTSENSDSTLTDSATKNQSAVSKQKESANNSKTSTPTNSRRNLVSGNSPTTKSQFYIPLPQVRKKVQFLVEDTEQPRSEDQYDEEEGENDNNSDEEDSYYDISSSSLSPAELKINYEYYNKRRHPQKLEHNENINDDSESEIIIYDEQFIQAMLLEKLQLDSELVTKKYNHTQSEEESEVRTTTTTAKTENNKTDYRNGISNGEQNKSQCTKQQENQNELKESEDEKNDKHYIKENLSNAKTSLSLSTTFLTRTSQGNNNNQLTIQKPTTIVKTAAETVLNPHTFTSTGSNSCGSSAPMEQSTTHMNNVNCINDDTDDNECLSSKYNNTKITDDGDNNIIITGLKKCDDSNNNVSNNSDSDDGHHKTTVTNADDHHHLNDVLLRVDVENEGNNVVNLYRNKRPTRSHNDNNHQQQHENDDAIDDGNANANISSSPSPVSKVQHNGAKKSTTCDYDDGAKTKQHQQQKQEAKQREQQKYIKKTKKDMQALAAVADSSSNVNFSTSNGNGSKNRRIPTKETQSRNPIRRSQSERQPTTAPATAAITMSTYNNSNVTSCKKKKDQQHKDIAHVDNGGSNENIIPNTRNSLKDIENILNNINDSESADCIDSILCRSTIAARGNGNKTSLYFQDTMALRNRYNRSDTRDLFSMALTGRPREPPPPPPSSSPTSPLSFSLTQNPPTIHSTTITTTTTTMDIVNAATTPLNNSLPKAVDLKEPTKVITLATNATESSEQQVPQQHQQQTLNGLESKQQIKQSLTIGYEYKAAETTTKNKTIFHKELNMATLIESKEHQQQIVRNTENSTVLTNSEKTTMDLSSSITPSPTSITTVQDKNKEQQTTTATIIGNNKQQQQKTIVRVAPFNKNSSEIHRLKISHTDNNNTYTFKTPNIPNLISSPSTSFSSSPFSNTSHYSVTDLSTLNGACTNEYGQKKTSILINGDDCYSTMNLSCDDSCTPLYQSSVVVTDGSTKITDNNLQGLRVTNTYNTVTINVSSPRSSEDELIHQHNQLNNLLKRQTKSSPGTGSIRAIIPIRGTIDINLQRSASSTSSTSTSSITSSCSSTSDCNSTGISKRGKTLIHLDYEKEKSLVDESQITSTIINEQLSEEQDSGWLPHEAELLKILRDPVEAVKRNLVPHICKLRESDTQKDAKRSKKMKEGHSDVLETSISSTCSITSNKSTEIPSFIGKLLEDPMLQQVADGLETDVVVDLIENSLKRLQESRNSLDMTGTKDNDDMNRLIDLSLKRIQEERNSANKHNSSVTTTCHNNNMLSVPMKDEERLSNRGSISSANSFASAHNYELFDFEANESDCYQSCSSDINSIIEEDIPSPETKTKFYQMLVDATLQEIELSTNVEDLANDEHQYESIRHNTDPIYEEISDVPPPLPLTAPPLSDPELEKKSARSIFEGASKYDILSYLVDAKERGLVKEEPFDYPLNCSNSIIIEEESSDTLSDLGKLNKLKRIDTISSRSSIMSDSSDDNQSNMSSLSPPTSNNFMLLRNKQATSDIERNDSGVGSETSKSSRSKFLNPSNTFNTTSMSSPTPTSYSSPSTTVIHPQPRSSPLHLCEDCDGPVEIQIGENGHIFVPLVCRKCSKKRVERKEIITEVVETEEKYGRDLQIILEEFCHPMLVAGLLTQEQLSAIFLNTEELLENNQTLAERMRDALDIALEQGDDDLLTVNIGKIFLESTQMLHAFESYCVRQAGASLLLANLEKEKELLRIFLKVSQMENAVLRRMNLNSFLMVPVQRVTKYPLLLARLYKVTPAHLEGREQLKQAQEKIELHLNHINQEAKDVPTKLWRRISSSSPNRRASCEIDMINIKLRKMAIDVLEWNHDEVRFVMEGKLLYTQPTDSNWKKARTIKLTTVNALLVTNGKPSTNYKAEKVMSEKLNFPKHTGIREASLLVVKEKCGRYTLIREPLYLDRCVICSEADWDEYFEIQEISSKDIFIFKAEDNVRTKQWYTQLQYHAQGMGAWRKRRNALANIMINGMLTRS